MNLFSESSTQPSGRAVLLSIKPKYADLILAGTKTIELRRSWPSSDIGVMILYSSSPVQKLVGLVYIEEVKEADIEGLWKLANECGGGVTYKELVEYFTGKKKAYGIKLKNAKSAHIAIDPKDIFPDFSPPQSFSYLKPDEYRNVLQKIFPKESV